MLFSWVWRAEEETDTTYVIVLTKKKAFDNRHRVFLLRCLRNPNPTPSISPIGLGVPGIGLGNIKVTAQAGCWDWCSTAQGRQEKAPRHMHIIQRNTVVQCLPDEKSTHTRSLASEKKKNRVHFLNRVVLNLLTLRGSFDTIFQPQRVCSLFSWQDFFLPSQPFSYHVRVRSCSICGPLLQDLFGGWAEGNSESIFL